MKILAILGIPHKGNTFLITQEIESFLKSHPDLEFEYLHLKDVDLKSCRGCYLCFHKGPEICPLKDDKPVITYLVIGEEYVPTEYNYFMEKGWFDKKARYFHTNVKHNFIKELPAKLVARMMKKQLAKAYSANM